MPRFNQTGPTGQGPKTGRQMGRCTDSGAKLKSQSTTDTENSEEKLPENILGRGLGLGCGRGRGGRGGRGMGLQNRYRGEF